MIAQSALDKAYFVQHLLFDVI